LYVLGSVISVGSYMLLCDMDTVYTNYATHIFLM
jgi:hypothetical protein